MKTFQDRLLKAIPGGTHTYSRGYDQFPSNAPQILKRGKGAYVYNDIESLEQLFQEYPGQITCVILEPASTEHPKIISFIK